MNLFPGDARILMLLYEFRFLTTGQLSLLTGRDPQIIRRAIRKRLRPTFVTAFSRRPTEEGAYTLGEQGLEFVAYELGCALNELAFPRRVSTARSFFFRHTLAISDVRVAFAIAAANAASPIGIDRSVAEWDVVPSSMPRAPRHERYVLSERFVGEDGRACSHRPDCMLLCYPKAAGNAQLVAVFVELDRNTESIVRRIAEKYHAYWLYWQQRRFASAFDAIAMRVLFVLDDVRERTRIRSMQDELRAFAERRADRTAAESFRRCFRFALKRDVSVETVLTRPVFFDADDEPRLFFQPPQVASDSVQPEAAQ
jgi:Replication-relaxation